MNGIALWVFLLCFSEICSFFLALASYHKLAAIQPDLIRSNKLNAARPSQYLYE